MIKFLDGFPKNIVAVACSDQVTRSDYDKVLVPAVEQALKGNENIRLYYQIGRDFAGIDAGAMWEDFSIGMEHLPRWERIAVVTDVEWIGVAVKAFGFLMPGKVRVFSLVDMVEARRWISAA